MKLGLTIPQVLMQRLRCTASCIRRMYSERNCAWTIASCLDDHKYHSSVLRCFSSWQDDKVIKDLKSGVPSNGSIQGSACPNEVSEAAPSGLLRTPRTSATENSDVYEGSTVTVDFTDSSLISVRDFERLPPKCTACGAVFHDLHEEFAGYLPKEKFSLIGDEYNNDSYLLSTGEKEIICQPCFNLRHRNLKVARIQNRESVSNQLKHLHETQALILYVVDLFDMYGTLVPDLSALIGSRKKIILIGNKIDKFPTGTYTTGGRQLNHLKEHLINASKEFSHSNLNIVDTCLISASHGFGLEDLVTKIIKHRPSKNHIYLVGGNNTGKSTLFNVLQNFLNLLAKKRPLPPQAIAHHTPGSTYSLVRYPIGKKSLIALRNLFLQPPSSDEDEAQLGLADDLVAELGIKRPPAKGDCAEIKLVENKKSPESAPIQQTYELVTENKASSRLFMYDTPGIPNSEQLLQFLTPQEIQFLKQTLWIVPETRLLHPGQVLLIGGLIRIDYIKVTRPSKEDISLFEDVPKASQSIFFTTFFPRNVPRHITTLDRVESLYERHLGNDLLKIPFGTEERLRSFPKLRPLEYNVVGCGWDRGAKDIVFNGLGWISVTAGHYSHVALQVHTPLGIGQHVKENPLLPEAIRRRGRRGGMYLGKPNRQIYQSTRRRNPALVEHLKERNQNVKTLMDLVAQKKRHDKLCRQFSAQQLRLEQGVVLGAFKRIGKLEKLLERNSQSVLESGEDGSQSDDQMP